MKVCSTCAGTFDAVDWQCPVCGHEPQIANGYLAFAPDVSSDKIGFEIEYFERLVRAEGGNFWFEARNRLLIWALRRYFPAGCRFLEIGCGTGFVMRGIASAFPAWELYGGDIFTEAIPYAASRAPSVTFMQLDARRLPFASEFDGVGIFDVLEHICEDTQVLTQMFEAVKPGGHAIISVPQHPTLWSPVDEYWGHFRRYTRSELTTKVEQAGFEVIYVTSFVSLLLPAMLLSRRRLNQPGNTYDPYEEYKTGPVNALLERIMGLERWLIRSGATFPAGGSLLLVAQRPYN
jgi:SAM-dependent methyltransferase